MAMTYVNALDVVIPMVDGEVAEKLTALRAQCAKKRSSSNSKARKEADERMEKAYAALAEMSEPVTITELRSLTTDEEVAGWNPQRVSALFSRLGSRVKREEIKGKAYFSIV